MKKLNIYIILLLYILYSKIIHSHPIDNSKCNEGSCVTDQYKNGTNEVLPSVVDQTNIENSNNSNDNEVDLDNYPNVVNNPSTDNNGMPEVEKNDGFNNNIDTSIDNNKQNVDNGNSSYNDDSSNQNNTLKQDNKSSKNESFEKSSNSASLNKKDNSRHKYFLIFLLILTAIIILIVLAILIYKKKYLQSSKQVMMNVIDNEIRPGNFMEKIKTINMDNPYIINNNNHINNNCPLFNFNMSNIINTNNLNSYDYENHFKNGYTVNKENNNYYKTFESMNRGLKPPPTHDNNMKKKNFIKVKSNTPLVITTKRKSKNSDISNTQKTNSGSYSENCSINRTSTEMSLALTPTNISHSSSNGGFGYKNNKLNKHTSVALTFGCRAVFDRESDSYNDSPNFTSPTRTSMITNNQSNSSSRVSSQKSLTSFITSRISSYISGGKRSYRKDSEYERSTNNTDDTSSRYTYYSKNKNYISGSDFGEISNSNSGSNSSAIDKKSNVNVGATQKSKGNNDSKSQPSKEKSTESELKRNNSEKLITFEHDLFASFLKDCDEKLDLTLSYGK